MLHLLYPHTHKSKKAKLDFVTDIDSDVQCTSVQTSPMLFNPISESVSRALCKNLKMEFEKVTVADPKTVGPLGVPCFNEKIVEDGNCFFRSVSLAISGTQKNHRKIRLAIVKQLENNSEVHISFARRLLVCGTIY